MATIFNLLDNAEYNLGNVISRTSLTQVSNIAENLLPLAKHQLHVAMTLLDKGYSLDDDVDNLLDKYQGDVDAVPVRSSES